MKYFHENRKYNDNNAKIQCSKNANFAFQAHYHNDIEIISVTKGTAVIGINAEIFELNAGDTAFIADGDIHYYTTEKEYESIMLIASVDFLYFQSYPETVIIRGNNTLSKNILELMSLLHDELSEKKNGYSLFCKNYIGLISSHILREDKNLIHIRKMTGHRSTMKHFKNVLEYIDNNCENSITLENAAEFMHYSRFYFSKLFKKLTGTSFVRYVNQKRISHAKQLIKETDLTFTDISSACGFENIRTFNREFKLICGLTPKEYRLKKR